MPSRKTRAEPLSVRADVLATANRKRRIGMILTIDIGNTNILLGCFKGNELVFRERISSKREATDLEYAATIYRVGYVHADSTTD